MPSPVLAPVSSAVEHTRAGLPLRRFVSLLEGQREGGNILPAEREGPEVCQALLDVLPVSHPHYCAQLHVTCS